MLDEIVAHARARPPRRGLRRRRRQGRPGHPGDRHGERRAVADVLPLRRAGAAAGLAQHGRRRRGAVRDLPLAHRDRGPPLAHRHRAGRRARRALPAGVDPRPSRTRCGRSASSTGRSPRSPSQSPDRTRNNPRVPGCWTHQDARTPRPLLGALPPWPSRSGSRRSCARTPTARRRSRARATRSPTSSRTSTAATRGLKGRLVTEEGGLHRFVNIYVNDEDVRFLGALESQLSDGDSVTVLPAVAGGGRASRRDAFDSLLDSVGRTPLVGLPRLSPSPRRPALGEARDGQPHRLDQGPGGARDGRAGRARGPAAARRHRAGADVGQHRHLAGDGLPPQGLPAGLRHAGEHLGRAAPAADDVRRRDRHLAGGGRLEPGRRGGQAARRARTPTG